MKKVKEIFNTTFSNLFSFIKKFPVTLCITLITTLFLIITLDADYIKADVVEKIMLFVAILGFETFFIETYFKNKIIKGILDGAGVLISLVFVFLLNIENGFLVEYKNMIETNTMLTLICYLILLFIFTIYKLVKISNLGFSKYLIKLFSNLFNSTIIYFIMNIGFTLISSIFVMLILNNKDFDIIFRIQIGLLGIFYIPAVLMSLFAVNKKEVNLFIKSIVVYIALPLVCITILIIYIYMAKIFLLKEIPSNVIYRILAGIFIVGFPIMYMAYNYKNQNKFLKYTLKILPYLFIPFIFLQVYSIVARYIDKGITPMRYISYMFLIFEVILLVLTIFKNNKKRMECMVISTTIILLITFVSPLNLISVSNLNQSHILKKAFYNETNFDNLSEENKLKAKSAYKYLVKQYNYTKYIPEYILKDEQKILKYFATNTTSINTEKDINNSTISTIRINIDDETIDVSNYSKITKVKINKGTNVDMANLELKNYNSNVIMKIDLIDMIKDIISGKLDKEKIKMENPKVLSYDKALYINSLTIKYDEESKNVSYILLNGYLLEK